MEEDCTEAIVVKDSVQPASRKKRQRPEYVDRVPKYMIRNQKLLLSDLQVNHDGYLGMFQPQPYDEEFAVCLLVAYGHIIGRRQGIKINTRDRRLFDKTAEVLHQKQPNVRGGFHNPRGHYHIQVLKVVLHKLHKKTLVGISLGTSSSIENDLQRSELLIAAIVDSREETFMFRGTIILTERGNVAKGHYVVIKKIPGQAPALLDGLFDGPKKLSVDALVRYTQIEALYYVSNE